MGDYADAVIECCGTDLRDRLAEVFDPYTYMYEERPNYAIVAIEQLGYGEEGLFCERLRELAISYAFFHCGDHEHTSVTRLYVPELGEWQGAADADGEVLVTTGVLDRIASDARARGLVTIAGEIDRASARAFRRLFEERDGELTGVPVPRPSEAAMDDFRQLLAGNSAFTYVRPHERYLVVLAVSYPHDSDPTETGERLASSRDAAHWAPELTRDGGSADTQWAVFDAEIGEWTVGLAPGRLLI